MSKYAENHEEMLLDKLRRYIDTEEYKYEAPYITKGDVEVIIHALEKQIHKKPIRKNDRNFKERKCFYCPNCKESLATNEDDTHYNYWLNHCDNC